MNKYKLFFTCAASLLLMSSCYDLDRYPEDQLSAGTFFQTQDHADQAMMGVYSQMTHNDVFGRQFGFDCLGGVGAGYDAPSYPNIGRGTYTTTEGAVGDKFKQLYEGVTRANIVLQNVDQCDMSDELKTRYKSEARFMRALYYFTLLDFWGGVPIYDETTIVAEDFSNMLKPRSSAEEVRTFIIKDLDEAIAHLPADWDESNKGRATSGAAMALKGKVLLYNKQYQEAATCFENVINSGKYALYSDYENLFKPGGDESSEMIFAIQNIGGVGTDFGMPMTFYMGSRASYGSCWNNTVPSTQLVDMYEFKDGRPFNWDEIFPGYNTMTPEQRKELLSVEMDGAGAIVGLREADTAKILSAYTCRDPRLMATVIVPYSHYMGNIGRTTNVDLIFALDHNLSGNANGGTIQNNAGWVSYLYRKFVTEGDQGGAISNRLHTPFAFPLIRFADVLLMLSEAYNEAGQLDKAVTEFNKVRTRVGMPGLNSGPEWMVVSNKEQMAERIRKERAVEFAGEGLRFSDLRRWGYEIAHKTLNNVDAVNIYGEPIYTHLFTERDMLWPIPGVERERNDALTQNPGW